MKRVVLSAVCVVALLTQFSVALADPPDRLRHYKIVPRRSVLAKTGGFAGVEEQYLLTGGFGLLEKFNSDWNYHVSLSEPEVWGSLISDVPTPAVVTDVDELLNLVGLDGKALPTAGPLPVFEFTGKISDGSSIRLLGLDRGNWLYLRGSTTPPPNTNDYFEYRVRMLARLAPSGDANADGVVDAADYTAHRDAMANADGPTSVGDLDLWRQQYGEKAPEFDALDAQLNAALVTAASAVPEPAALAIVAIATLGFTASSLRRR